MISPIMHDAFATHESGGTERDDKPKKEMMHKCVQGVFLGQESQLYRNMNCYRSNVIILSALRPLTIAGRRREVQTSRSHFHIRIINK